MTTSPFRKRWFPWSYLIFCALSIVLLFLGFYRNQWQAARDKKFSGFDKASESLILGRLVQSRQNGVFSEAALLGLGDTDPTYIKEPNVDHQYDTYLNGGEF